MVCDPIQQEIKKTRIKILRWDNSPVRAIVPSHNQTPLLGLNIDFRDHVTGQASIREGKNGVFAVSIGSRVASVLLACALACVIAWDAY